MVWFSTTCELHAGVNVHRLGDGTDRQRNVDRADARGLDDDPRLHLRLKSFLFDL
jgi:hypothetical protein